MCGQTGWGMRSDLQRKTTAQERLRCEQTNLESAVMGKDNSILLSIHTRAKALAERRQAPLAELVNASSPAKALFLSISDVREEKEKQNAIQDAHQKWDSCSSRGISRR